MYFVRLVGQSLSDWVFLRNSSAVFIFLLYPLQIVHFWSFVGYSGQRLILLHRGFLLLSCILLKCWWWFDKTFFINARIVGLLGGCLVKKKTLRKTVVIPFARIWYRQFSSGKGILALAVVICFVLILCKLNVSVEVVVFSSVIISHTSFSLPCRYLKCWGKAFDSVRFSSW